MSKFILDVEKLCLITGENQKDVADTLGVSAASLSESKTVPTKRWGIIRKYMSNYGDILPLDQFIVESKSEQDDNS